MPVKITKQNPFWTRITRIARILNLKMRPKGRDHVIIAFGKKTEDQNLTWTRITRVTRI